MGDMVVIDEQIFTDIADAIRDRNGEETTYKPREMAEAVEDLHNVRPKKWTRPSDWPDYSKVDLTDQEVIYLTYDCSYDSRWCSVKVSGAYTVERGSLNNGVFTSVYSANQASASTFQQQLPTNEGTYVVYRITPQEGAHITSFRFMQVTDSESNSAFAVWWHPCIERYARLPNMTGSLVDWSTRLMVADTVMDMAPNNMTNAFNNGGNSLHYIDYSKSSFKNVTTFLNVFYNQYVLSECYLPHDVTNKCTIFQSIFNNCYALNNIDLSGWDTSNGTNFSNMFRGCRELIEIKGIEDFDVSNATTLANMFDGCYMLRKLDISKWVTTDELTALNAVFQNLYQISELDVSGFNTENVTNFSNMFSGCQNAEVINVSNLIVSNKVTSLASMFSYCRKLRTIIRNRDWDTSNVTSFDSMFRECKLLQNINLSDFDFSKATTVRYMFIQCNALRKIKGTFNFPLITNKTNVQDFASNCWQLEDISEMSITNSTYMPSFAYDYSILYFRMPVVTNLADYCLRDMNHIRYFDFRDYTSVPALAAYTDINAGKNTKMKIIVPDDLYDTWIAATNWSNTNIKQHIISASDYEASLVTE